MKRKLPEGSVDMQASDGNARLALAVDYNHAVPRKLREVWAFRPDVLAQARGAGN